MNILGFDINQNEDALVVWDLAMEQENPARVIELGSYNGGFAILLAVAGFTKRVKVWSYDVMEAPKEEWRSLKSFFGISFVRADVFAVEQEIGAQIGWEGPTFLLCDGGDKVREFKTFAKYLKRNDVIAAHDFGRWWPADKVEVRLGDVQKTAEQYGLKRFLPDEMEWAGWIAYQKP